MAISLYEKVIKAKNIINTTIQNNEKGIVGVACAFGRSSLVLLHLIQRTSSSLPVIFADTGYHHPQILSTMNDFVRDNELELIIVKPKATFEQFHSFQIDTFPSQGIGINQYHDMMACCQKLKIEPISNICNDRGISVCIIGHRKSKQKPCGDERYFILNFATFGSGSR